MKVIIFNDTSNFHHGCVKVMEYLHKDLQNCGHKIIASVKGKKHDRIKIHESFIEADMVIVNGEGSMHHDRPFSHELLQILRNAKAMGKKTALINTLWQSMTVDDEIKEVLLDTYISVREVESQYEMYKTIGTKVDMHLDLSYFVDVPEKVSPQRELLIGTFFSQKNYRPENIPVLDISKNDWNSIVNVLRATDWFITGRHHELYASCKARCPFSALDGNSHKNIGLIKSAGVDIPIESPTLPHDKIPMFLSKCKERRIEYEKLFNWMEQQPKFTVANFA